MMTEDRRTTSRKPRNGVIAGAGSSGKDQGMQSRAAGTIALFDVSTLTSIDAIS